MIPLESNQCIGPYVDLDPQGIDIGAALAIFSRGMYPLDPKASNGIVAVLFVLTNFVDYGLERLRFLIRTSYKHSAQTYLNRQKGLRESELQGSLKLINLFH